MSHPIQYQAPLLRRIAQEPDIELTVFFGSDFSVRGYKDEGFGVGVKWDVPLLDGYRHDFCRRCGTTLTQASSSPINHGIASRLRGGGGAPASMCCGSMATRPMNALHGMIAAKSLGIPVLLRAESWLRDRARSDSLADEALCSFKRLQATWSMASCPSAR